MKKLSKILLLLLIPFSFFVANTSFAAEDYCSNLENPITVTVTEEIPWACCTEAEWSTEKNPKYDCKIAKWFWSVVYMIWEIIKYFTFLAGLWAVLFIVVNGILYSMSWVDQSMKDDAKKRITKTLVWLIVLLLSWVILNLIAPWIYKL